MCGAPREQRSICLARRCWAGKDKYIGSTIEQFMICHGLRIVMAQLQIEVGPGQFQIFGSWRNQAIALKSPWVVAESNGDFTSTVRRTTSLPLARRAATCKRP